MSEFNKEPETGTQPLTPDVSATQPMPPMAESTPAEQPEIPEKPIAEEPAAEPAITPEIAPETISEEPAYIPEEPYISTEPLNQATELLGDEPEIAEPASAESVPSMPQQTDNFISPYPPQQPANDGPTAYYYNPQQPANDGPTAYYYQPAPGSYPPPKRRMPTGLKVLIISMCILFGVSLIGFVGYGVYSFVDTISNGTGYDSFDSPDGFHVIPDEEQETEEDPDTEITEETEENEITIPDIDVVPNTDGIQLHSTPTTGELDITEVYDKVMRSTVLVLVTAETGTGSGTGIIATEDGYIITNSHVVLNTRNVEVQVKMNDGEVHDAVVVGFDKTTDLAVLKIEGTGYTPAEFADSDDLRMGQWVIAIGNPGGEQFSGSITRGIVSGLNRSVGSYSANGMTYIQTDAAINPGNSGGPLVNLYGQVVGINSAKIVSDEYEGMGFAIPITGAKSIIDDLLSGGYVQGRVRFGIKGTELSEMQAYMADLPQGFMISEIDDDSSFIGTDVQPYDIITKIDGEDTPTLDALSNALLSYAPGDTVTVTLVRPHENGMGGDEFEVEVVLLADLGETQK